MRLHTALLTGMACLLLAACNLQYGPQPTPTPRLTSTPPTPILSPTPTSLAPNLPTLQPTPTQGFFPPVTVTLPVAVTPLPDIGIGIATVDPATAIGRYPATVRAGDALALSYDVVVTRGTLIFTIQGAEGLLWQKVFTGAEASRHEIPSVQGGTYELLIQTQNFDGSYNFRWE